MKYTGLLFIFVFGLYQLVISQNYIIAGQTDSINNTYTDYEPDFKIVYPGVNTMELDIDSNGVNDFLFKVHYINHDNEYITWWTSVDLLTNHIKIITETDGAYVNSLYKGDTISDKQLWNTDTSSSFIFDYYFTIKSTGYQYHKGYFAMNYLGYKVMNPTDTLYGWLYMQASYREIDIYENAMLSSPLGIIENEVSNNPFRVYPNPCHDKIILNDNSALNRKTLYEIRNIYGIEMQNGSVSSEHTEISTSNLAPGLYSIRVLEGSKVISALKFIKLKE